MLQIHHRDLSGCQSSRIVRPLGLTMFDAAWLRTICCERSGDSRHLRADRIEDVPQTGNGSARSAGNGLPTARHWKGCAI